MKNLQIIVGINLNHVKKLYWKSTCTGISILKFSHSFTSQYNIYDIMQYIKLGRLFIPWVRVRGVFTIIFNYIFCNIGFTDPNVINLI